MAETSELVSFSDSCIHWKNLYRNLTAPNFSKRRQKTTFFSFLGFDLVFSRNRFLNEVFTSDCQRKTEAVFEGSEVDEFFLVILLSNRTVLF